MQDNIVSKEEEKHLLCSLVSPSVKEAIISSCLPSILIDNDSKILWADLEFAKYFGFCSVDDFINHDLPLNFNVTKQLETLLNNTKNIGKKHLEKLRFIIGLQPILFTTICENIILSSGKNALIISILEVNPNFLHKKTLFRKKIKDNTQREDKHSNLEKNYKESKEDKVEDLSAKSDDIPNKYSSFNDINHSNNEKKDIEEQIINEVNKPYWLHLPLNERHPLRFNFTLNKLGNVLEINQSFSKIVGFNNANILGQNLIKFISNFDNRAASIIENAIQTKYNWNNVEVYWPVENSNIFVPILISGILRSNQKNIDQIFSCFGRCQLDKAEERLCKPNESEEIIINEASKIEDMASSITVPINEASKIEDMASSITVPINEASKIEDMASSITVPINETNPKEDYQDEYKESKFSEAVEQIDLEAHSYDNENSKQPFEEKDLEEKDLKEQAFPSIETKDIISTNSIKKPLLGKIISIADLRKDNNLPSRLDIADEDNFSNTHNTSLSVAERSAFIEIARTLGANIGINSSLKEYIKDDVSQDEIKADEDTSDDITMLSNNLLQGSNKEETAAILEQLPLGVLILNRDEVLFANKQLLSFISYPDISTIKQAGGISAILGNNISKYEEISSLRSINIIDRMNKSHLVQVKGGEINWDEEKASSIFFYSLPKEMKPTHSSENEKLIEISEMNAALDIATDGIFILDEEKRIIRANQATYNLLGFNEKEILNKNFISMFNIANQNKVINCFDKISANNTSNIASELQEVFLTTAQGANIPLLLKIGCIPLVDSHHFCVVLRDLTTWQQAEKELIEARLAAELANAKKSDFLTKVSHEIRTPMNAVLGFAELMMEEKIGPIGTPEYKEYLKDIHTSGQHVISLVNDLLDLAKIEAGRMEMNFIATDINSIITSCLSIIQPQANSNRVLVRSQLDQKLPSIVADERSIRQIVLNMLSNATRFTESGGQVIISTSLLSTGEAVIHIRDTGIGMSASEIDQSLEPFRQVGTRKGRGGTGLGLPLTKALVEANRANFSISSTPGEGTMIAITFPSTRVLAE